MDCISECFSDVVIMLQGSTDVTDVGLLLSIFMIFVHFVCSLLIKEPLSQAFLCLMCVLWVWNTQHNIF